MNASTDTPWHICVLIPARNEEELLPRCLRSILAACAQLPATVSCDIVVAVNHSTDRTWQIARKMLRNHGLAMQAESRVVGDVRALAATTALMRYPGPLDRCWLANTDADCQVPPDWLVTQLSLAAEGVHAVAGIVDVDSFVEHDRCVEQRFRDTYLVRPDGSHPHVHGANLGVRADTYLQAGGWGDLATAEDHDLWQRISALACRRRSTDRLQVLTSGRRAGRAPCGFADALASHNARTA